MGQLDDFSLIDTVSFGFLVSLLGLLYEAGDEDDLDLKSIFFSVTSLTWIRRLEWIYLCWRLRSTIKYIRAYHEHVSSPFTTWKRSTKQPGYFVRLG